MKKLIEQIKEKAMLGIVMSMLGIGGTFLFNTGKVMWNLPDTVNELKTLHKQDSIRAIHYISKIDSLDKVVKQHESWLGTDYTDIQNIKNQLGIK